MNATKGMHSNRVFATLLAGIVGSGVVAHKSGSISDLVDSAKTAVVNAADEFAYGQNFGEIKYSPVLHRIKRGDTIAELSGENIMAADYIRAKNCIQNVGSLQPGTEITILKRSEDGTPLRELLRQAEAYQAQCR